MSNREELIRNHKGGSVYLYTQGAREGKIQGSAEFVKYDTLQAALDDGVDVLDLVNSKLRAVAVNAAAGISNTDGVETLKSLNNEIKDVALEMASGRMSTEDGQVKMVALIAKLNARKAK